MDEIYENIWIHIVWSCQWIKRWKIKVGTCDKLKCCAPQAFLRLHYLFCQFHWNYAPQKIHLIWSLTFAVNAMSVFSTPVQLCNSILGSLYLSYEGVIFHCCIDFLGSLHSSSKQNSNLIQQADLRFVKKNYTSGFSGQKF